MKSVVSSRKYFTGMFLSNKVIGPVKAKKYEINSSVRTFQCLRPLKFDQYYILQWRV